jgi:hypothetical protein
MLNGVDYEGLGGHRVYEYFFYTDRLVGKDSAGLMKLLEKVQNKLNKRQAITEPIEETIAELCFTVKSTPVRGNKVTPVADAIDRMRRYFTGLFVIRSNDFKSSAEAFAAYRLRDGVEKRFDDMKNQEDMERLRSHLGHNMRVRIFLQFIAQIMRCDALDIMQQAGQKEHKSRVKTVPDLYNAIDSIRRIRVGNNRALYKRPTEAN